ncbi:HAD family hydrolase [Sphingomonas sp. WKB10]|nr:HAD family hydrolase [Sphingomonas sp. WKB10]
MASGEPLPFIIATGRGFDAARMILKRWRLPQPDAFIVDVGTRLMLPDGTGGWRACADYARSLDADWDRDAVAATLAPLGVTAQPAATAGPHKISFYGGAADAGRIRAALSAAGLAARVIFSHGRLIDVLAPTGGKAQAIAAYAARRGLTLADCIAAGDSGNDADMLTACGHAIAVGNAGANWPICRHALGCCACADIMPAACWRGWRPWGWRMRPRPTCPSSVAA